MHSYFRAIGFSKLVNKKEQNKIISLVINESFNKKEFLLSKDTKLVQINQEFGNHIGISVIGEYDSNGLFTMEHAFPYCIGDTITKQPDFQTEGYPDKEAYSGISEDYNLGLTLIYYIQNVIDYMNIYYVNQKINTPINVRFGALSLHGRILYNVQLDHISYPYDKQPISNKDRKNLMAKAKNGDIDAIENLTLDDMDTYSLVSKRIKDEDLFTVIETYFMPYGINNEHYSILGIIKNIEEITNEFSGEIVYNIAVVCNDITINVVINSKDLEGEPKIGRRFKGIIWLQGAIHFA